ncbi:2-octaprenyl-6-methoxyphenyl hydroxylase [Amylibacter marinus]|uniref:2-octaprenyl-6-methoxyphenyl hydroxylase n=1 Tax=Amylibacter marinus TaxID=1475483 RepID=A0ABQ5VVE8_9RHOB|nr:UbiH/UbiF/VisC/COQ6 family ubiquinone biosynthesis hydroxylase [Amylibacter marinus]GLQ35416.1 2-octaprenyl-6-methoxyphenyl hydroxylase [Amylibacter marinus]
MKFDTDIVIAGAGLNGCAMALALASVGIASVIVDPQLAKDQQSPAFDGRAYSLAHGSVRMLQVLGVWNSIATKAQPILDIKVTDGKAGQGAGPQFLHFDHRELEEGPMGQMIEDRYLRRAMLDLITNTPLIRYIEGTSVTGHRPQNAHVEVTLSDDTKLLARLLVGCDGRRSNTARDAGLVRRGWDYDQSALVCAVEHELPHNGTAHQFFTPSGPLAILPLAGRRSSIVWSETAQRAAEIAQMNDTDFLTALRPVFGDFLGEIALAGARFSYPLTLSLVDDFVGARVALVGDAAHGIHPLAGQGLNLGLKDVASLSEVLAMALRRGEDIGRMDVLARYQTWRRFDTQMMAAATDGINRLFSNDNLFLRGLRDMGLGSVNAMPNLRRGFMRHAAGLSGDLPKLMLGQGI